MVILEFYLEDSTLWFNQLQHLLLEKKPKKLSIHFQTIYCMPVDGLSINSELHFNKK
jgi:hypothetical protein